MLRRASGAPEELIELLSIQLLQATRIRERAVGMFVNLFKTLKRRGVPVTFNEWLVLQNALAENLADSSLTRFYYLARAILIKTEAHFDKYDQAFLECFGHIDSDEDLIRTIEERLLKLPPLELSEEEKQMVERLSLEEVRARFLSSCKIRMTSCTSEGTGP